MYVFLRDVYENNQLKYVKMTFTFAYILQIKCRFFWPICQSHSASCNRDIDPFLTHICMWGCNITHFNSWQLLFSLLTCWPTWTPPSDCCRFNSLGYKSQLVSFSTWDTEQTAHKPQAADCLKSFSAAICWFFFCCCFSVKFVISFLART